MDRRISLHDIVSRVVTLFVVILLILTLDFLLVRAQPDEVSLVPKTNDSDFVREIRLEYHLNEPLTVQYYYFITETLALDFHFSVSIRKGQDIGDLVSQPLVTTVALFVSILALSLLLGIVVEALLLGVRNPVRRKFTRLIALALMAVPALYLGYVLAVIDSWAGQPLPLWSPPHYNETIRSFLDSIAHSILPIFAGVLSTFGFIPALVKGSDPQPKLKTGFRKRIRFVVNALYERPWFLKFYFAWILMAVIFVDYAFDCKGLGLIMIFEAVSLRDIPVFMISFYLLGLMLAILNFGFGFLQSLKSRGMTGPHDSGLDSDSQAIVSSGTGEHRMLAFARETWGYYRMSRSGTIAIVVVIVIAAIALLSPIVAPVTNPYQVINLEPPHPSDGWLNPLPPSFDPSPYTGVRHLLGTDTRGSDVLSMFLYGFQGSLLISVFIIALLVPLGVLAGITGFGLPPVKGTVTKVLRWIMLTVAEALVALPILLVLFGLFFGSSFKIELWLAIPLTILALYTWAWIFVAQKIRRTERRLIQSYGIGSPTFERLLPEMLRLSLSVAKFAFIGVLIAVLALDSNGLVFREFAPTWGTMLHSVQSMPLDLVWWILLLPTAATAVLTTSLFVIIDTVERAIRMTGVSSRSSEPLSKTTAA